jgi:hypothetical protein
LIRNLASTQGVRAALASDADQRKLALVDQGHGDERVSQTLVTGSKLRAICAAAIAAKSADGAKPATDLCKAKPGRVSTATTLVACTTRADDWVYAGDGLTVLSPLSQVRFREPPRM